MKKVLYPGAHNLEAIILRAPMDPEEGASSSMGV